MAIIKWDELQLKFDLPELDEGGEETSEQAVSPEQTRLISETARRVLEEQPELRKPKWMADYTTLRGQGWPWRVACYIAWAGSPRIDRWPKTLDELATQTLGLRSARVIHRWRQKYPSIDTIISMMQSRELWEHRADVFKALVESASNPNYKGHRDRKLFFEMTQDYTPRTLVGLGKAGKGGELLELSDEELRRWAASGMATDGRLDAENATAKNAALGNGLNELEETVSLSGFSGLDEPSANDGAAGAQHAAPLREDEDAGG